MPKENKIIWGCCAIVNDSDEQGIECIKCRKTYHLTCVAINSKQDDWLCPTCTSTFPKNVNKDNTPVRVTPNVTFRSTKRQALSSPPDNETSLMTQDDVRNIMNDVLKSQLSSFVKELNTSVRETLDKELKSVKDEIKEMHNSMNFMNDKFEEVMEQQKRAQKTIKELQADNNSLQSTVSILQSRVNQLEQSARSNNIEVQCLPENKSEDLLKCIKKIGEAINCELFEDDIMRITRIAKFQKDSPRPRSVVVEFKNHKLRDTFLAAAINFNKNNPKDRLNSSHLDFTDRKTPIYICEHLSVANKALHAVARQTAKEKGFKFVWVRGGKVYLRRNESAGFLIVKDLESLAAIK
jgi:predicted flap endonuclease-1-like 5' DNA nuclease